MATSSWLWSSYQDGVSGGTMGGGPGSPPSPASTPVDRDEHTKKIDGRSDPTANEPSSPGCGEMLRDVRMPELSYGNCSSPGARQVDDPDESTLDSTLNTTMVTTRDPLVTTTATTSFNYGSPPPKARSQPRRLPPKKRRTALEAYNKGMLLQYILDEVDVCCNKHAVEDTYETNWVGHQPLTPSTWDYEDAATDDEGSIVSASERRMMRRRLRRGVMSPSRKKVGIDKFEGVLGKVHNKPPMEINSHFPDELVDPHVCPKEKWKPNCDSAVGGMQL